MRIVLRAPPAPASLSAWLCAFFPTSLCLGALGCVAPRPPVMVPATPADPIAGTAIAPPPDGAVVVFVRAPNACDQGAPFRIVSESLAFVGESAPGTKFASVVPPGHRAFFAWQPYGDVPHDKYPLTNQVGAFEADFEAGRLYVVEVSIANAPFGTRRTCGRFQWVRLRRADPFAEPEVSTALSEATPMNPDVILGQRVVDATREETELHVAMGMRKLRPDR